VELDAIEPSTLQTMCRNAIEEIFDNAVSIKLNLLAQNEAIKYRSALKDFISTL